MKPSLKRAFKLLPPEVQAALREFGRIGGKLGGRQGGIIRSKRLSPRQRRAIARKAAQARWARVKGKRTNSPS